MSTEALTSEALTTPVVAPTRLRRLTKARLVAELLSYAFLLVSGLIMLAPLLWMFVNAFKEQWEIVNVPMIWFPEYPRYDNFLYVLERSPIGYGYLNSLI